jgi:hypothetical protein
MYKVSYYTTENKDVIFIKWFKSLKDSTEFVLKLKLPELLIEIKYYDENDPNNPRPSTLS